MGHIALRNGAIAAASFPCASDERSTTTSTQTPSPAPCSALYVDGLCGAGKSHAAAQDMAPRILSGERFLVAGVTKAQCRQFADDLMRALNAIRFGGRALVHVVNDDTFADLGWSGEDHSVQQALAAVIARTKGNKVGCAVVVTHATLLLLPHARKPEGWHLVVDEAPACVVAEEMKLPHHLLRELRFREALDGGPIRMRSDAEPLAQALDRLRAECDGLEALAAGASAAGDAPGAGALLLEARRVRVEEIEPILVLLRRVRSGHWIVVPRRGDLCPDRDHDVGDRKAVTEHRFRLRLDEAARCTSLVLTSIVDWTAFLGVGRTRWASATFLAANFRDSFSGLAMRGQGVALAESDTISARLRFRGAHPNGGRVTVLAATSRKVMSKRLAGADLGAGETVGERVLAAIRALWPDADYCWSHNRDVPDDALAGVRMPVIAHGLNLFSAFTKVAALAAMNLPNHLLAALAEAGFPAGAVRRAIMIENTYQSVLRSAARDPNSTAEVMMVVPDMDCADFVASMFPAAKIGLLGVAEPPKKSPGRPKMHDGGDADRKAFGRDMNDARKAISAEVLRERALADIREGRPTFEVHAYGDVHQKTPTATSETDNFDDLARFLRGWFEEAPGSSKKDNWLLLQARLQAADPERAGGHATVRGEINVERRSTLWLDIESLGDGRSGPSIPLAELRRVLGVDLRMVAYTSFNHRAAPGGLRYRVVIPLSAAVGVDCYRVLYRLVLDALERARWMTWRGETEVRKGRFHGIDVSKAPACSMFYAPLRAAEAEKDAWFEDLPGEPLDVRAWLARDLVRCLPPEDLLPPPPATWETVEDIFISPMTPWDRDLLLRRADEMCSGYLALGHGVQDGELNRLAWRLARLGLPLAEIEQRLLDCAAGSRSRADRTRQVPRIMAALTRRGPG